MLEVHEDNTVKHEISMSWMVMPVMYCSKRSESSNSNNSNDEQYIPDKDFREFYEQLKLHTALPSC